MPAPRVLLFGLAPGDAYPANHVATAAVGSYSTISPLPDPDSEGLLGCRPSAVYFLWRGCRIAPPGRYPAPLPSGVRTFLPDMCPGDHLISSNAPITIPSSRVEVQGGI